MAEKIPQISLSVDIAEEPVTDERPKVSPQRPLGIGRWLTMMQTAAYRKLVPGNDTITDSELFLHRSPEDMWMALPQHGKLCVFDVTEFARYHPGGIDVLLQNAGTDATEAYRMAHSYVNVNIIEKYRRGFLHRSQIGQARFPNQLLPSMIPSRAPNPLPKKPKWDWTLTDQMNMSVIIEFPQFQTAFDSLSWVDNLRALAVWVRPPEDSSRGTLIIRTLLDDGTYHRIALRLLPSLSPRLSSLRLTKSTSRSAPDVTGSILSTDRFSLSLDIVHIQPKSPPSLSSIGSVVSDTISSSPDADSDESFFTCRVKECERVADSPYRLVRLCWSSDTAWMPVPLGHHVMLRIRDQDGHLISRPYTPVTDNLTFSECQPPSDPVSATMLCLLIKIYPHGQMSQLIDKLKPGDDVEISYPMGSVSPNFLTQIPAPTSLPTRPQQGLIAVFMLAAGSGITPMVRPLELLLACGNCPFSDPTPTVHLICFNRTPADQVLVSELDGLSRRLPHRLSLLYVLSDSSPMELGENCVTGTISDPICRRGLLTLQFKDKEPSALGLQTLWLICGPLGFNNAAIGIAKQWGVPSRHIIQFKG
ncbi:cytochrome b5 reductase 4 [Clonorchis sinensis]|uniref:Cytochrome b5 reductase 4 n=1 Tax=Clonorchis sinensis TaxID=79923 RepID=G7YLT1_CLOSI|nr:cytochrome b5 reductase 4 [Clonorchis sinensis]